MTKETLADEKKPLTMYQAWQELLEDAADDTLFRVSAVEESRFLSYSAASLWKRASRIALALMTELRLEKGTRVAVLCDDPNDYLLLVHGIFLAQCVAVPLSLENSDDFLFGVLNNCNVKAVVFPPAASARVAGMFTSAFTVEHWIVSGGGMAPGTGSEIQRLDDLLRNVLGEELLEDPEEDPDAGALIVFSGGWGGERKGVLFSQQRLLAGAKGLATRLEPLLREEALIWSTLQPTAVNGIVLHFFLPFFSRVPTVVSPLQDPRQFWEEVRALGVSVAFVDQRGLIRLNRAGKSKSWLAPEKDLQICVTAGGALSPELFATFEKRFRTPLLGMYSCTELGGMVSVLPPKMDAEEREAALYDFDIPSSGGLFPGVDVRIVDSNHQEQLEGEVGEIAVRSPAAMKGYVGTAHGEMKFDNDSFLHTGDEGFAVAPSEEEPHLFVIGRMSDVILRNNQRVRPGRIDNLLYQIRGVEYGVAVGFPNSFCGEEIGAYVITSHAANLTEEAILSALRESLDWPECPKVILLGEREDGTIGLPRRELRELFSNYAEIDFARGRGL